MKSIRSEYAGKRIVRKITKVLLSGALVLTVVLVVPGNYHVAYAAPLEDCDLDGFDDATGVPVPWPGYDETKGDTPEGPAGSKNPTTTPSSTNNSSGSTGTGETSGNNGSGTKGSTDSTSPDKTDSVKSEDTKTGSSKDTGSSKSKDSKSTTGSTGKGSSQTTDKTGSTAKGNTKKTETDKTTGTTSGNTTKSSTSTGNTNPDNTNSGNAESNNTTKKSTTPNSNITVNSNKTEKDTSSSTEQNNESNTETVASNDADSAGTDETYSVLPNQEANQEGTSGSESEQSEVTSSETEEISGTSEAIIAAAINTIGSLEIKEASGSILHAGSSVIVSGSGFAGNIEKLEIVIQSEPRQLGFVDSLEDGSFEAQLEIPESLSAGVHHIVVLYQGNEIIRQEIVVGSKAADSFLEALSVGFTTDNQGLIPGLLILSGLLVVGTGVLGYSLLFRSKKRRVHS